MCVCAQLLNDVQVFPAPWTVVCRAGYYYLLIENYCISSLHLPESILALSLCVINWPKSQELQNYARSKQKLRKDSYPFS